MQAKNYWNLLRGKTKVMKPATMTWQNIRAVIQSWWRKGRQVAGFDLPIHVYEQIIWRRCQVITISPECWDSGQCKVCGCDILGKTMEDRECSASEMPGMNPCYPAMMNEQTWKKYKTKLNIKLFD